MVEDEAAKNARARLEKILGQVRGISKMIEDRRYCVDILNQIEAARSALAGVSRVVLGNHIRTCVAETMRSGNEAQRKQKIDELTALYARFCGNGS